MGVNADYDWERKARAFLRTAIQSDCKNVCKGRLLFCDHHLPGVYMLTIAVQRILVGAGR